MHVHCVFKDSSALPLLENLLFSCRQSSTLFDSGAGQYLMQKGNPMLTAYRSTPHLSELSVASCCRRTGTCAASLKQEGGLLPSTEAVSMLLAQKYANSPSSFSWLKSSRLATEPFFLFLPKPLTVGLWSVRSSSLWCLCCCEASLLCIWRTDAEAVSCGRTAKSPFQRSQTQTLKNTSPANTVPLSETSLRLRVYSKRMAPLLSYSHSERLQGTLSLPCKSANPFSQGDPAARQGGGYWEIHLSLDLDPVGADELWVRQMRSTSLGYVC